MIYETIQAESYLSLQWSLIYKPTSRVVTTGRIGLAENKVVVVLVIILLLFSYLIFSPLNFLYTARKLEEHLKTWLLL